MDDRLWTDRDLAFMRDALGRSRTHNQRLRNLLGDVGAFLAAYGPPLDEPIEYHDSATATLLQRRARLAQRIREADPG